MYCIYQHVYCICHHLHQEAHLGVLHSPPKSTTAIMCIKSLTWCTVFASLCTAYAIIYIRRHTWVYCIPSKSTTAIMCTKSLTRCTVFASRCTAYAIMYIRRHTWVFCIPLKFYNSHHVHQEPHLVYCICQ